VKVIKKISSPEKKRVLGVIPARFNSTRFPGKPLALIKGKPMIQRVYERCQRSALIDDLIVATDHPQIQKTVESFGGRVKMTSANLPSGTDRIVEAILDDPAEIIINIQGDEPLIDPALIDQTLQPCLQGRAQVSTPVMEIDNEDVALDPNIVKVVTTPDWKILYFSRTPIPSHRMEGKKTWLQHIGLYVYNRETLLQYSQWSPTPLEQKEKLEQLRLLEHGITILAVLTRYQGCAVDVPADIQKVEQWL